MANPIQNAMIASRKSHKTLGGVEITISRGVTTSGVVVATIGFSGETVYEEDGTTYYTKHRDYLVDVVDYKTTGSALSPQRHDVITESLGGVVHTFEVVSASNDGPDNYDDVDRIMWRVHTKELT